MGAPFLIPQGTLNEKVVYLIASSVFVFINFMMEHREMVKSTGSAINFKDIVLLSLDLYYFQREFCCHSYLCSSAQNIFFLLLFFFIIKLFLFLDSGRFACSS